MNLKHQVKELMETQSKSTPSFDEDMMHSYFSGFDFNDLNVKLETQQGGEGEGDNYFTVYSFSNNEETVYVQFQGWYASYQGAEFTEWFFVEPKEVTVTVYDKV